MHGWYTPNSSIFFNIYHSFTNLFKLAFMLQPITELRWGVYSIYALPIPNFLCILYIYTLINRNYKTLQLEDLVYYRSRIYWCKEYDNDSIVEINLLHACIPIIYTANVLYIYYVNTYAFAQLSILIFYFYYYYIYLYLFKWNINLCVSICTRETENMTFMLNFKRFEVEERKSEKESMKKKMW